MLIAFASSCRLIILLGGFAIFFALFFSVKGIVRVRGLVCSGFLGLTEFCHLQYTVVIATVSCIVFIAPLLLLHSKRFSAVFCCSSTCDTQTKQRCIVVRRKQL